MKKYLIIGSAAIVLLGGYLFYARTVERTVERTQVDSLVAQLQEQKLQLSYLEQSKKLGSAASQYNVIWDSDGAASIGNISTSTQISIGTTASTTLLTLSNQDDVNSIAYYVTITSSSSAVTGVSFGEDLSLNTIDWHSQRPTNIANIAAGAGSGVYQLFYNNGTGGVASTSPSFIIALASTFSSTTQWTFNFPVLLPSKYRRLKAQAIGGNAMVHVTAIGKIIESY